jgi:hypothetical protein
MAATRETAMASRPIWKVMRGKLEGTRQKDGGGDVQDDTFLDGGSKDGRCEHRE